MLMGRERFHFIFLLSVCLISFSSCKAENLSTGFSFLKINGPITTEAKGENFTFTLVGTESIASILSFALVNKGSTSIEITQIELSEPEIFTFYSVKLPGLIPPNGSAQFTLGFYPRLAGSYSGSLSMIVKGYNKPFSFQILGISTVGPL